MHMWPEVGIPKGLESGQFHKNLNQQIIRVTKMTFFGFPILSLKTFPTKFIPKLKTKSGPTAKGR